MDRFDTKKILHRGWILNFSLEDYSLIRFLWTKWNVNRSSFNVGPAVSSFFILSLFASTTTLHCSRIMRPNTPHNRVFPVSTLVLWGSFYATSLSSSLSWATITPSSVPGF